MEFMEDSREYKAAMALESAISDLNFKPERFAKACCNHMHKTNQQTLFRVMMALIKAYGDPDRVTDPRNRASKEISVRILEALGNDTYIPFI